MSSSNRENTSLATSTATIQEKHQSMELTIEQAPSLSRKELWDITFLVLAFSCVVANMTLVVGTGAVVILSIGGSNSLAPLTLAIFFLGMSLVSLIATHWIFVKWGRKVGFWVGCACGMVGVAIACLALMESSAALFLLAQVFLGGSAGMGMYLRYSAVEVVPPTYSSKAVAWVLAGGCLAAFVGPEASQATKGVFGDESDDKEHLTYLGTFLVAAGFLLLQAFFVGLVGFQVPSSKSSSDKNQHVPVKGDYDDEEIDEATKPSQEELSNDDVSLGEILKKRSFILPLLAAILSWAIMAMPMSIFRVTMKELGFTDRQSLTVIEIHFVSMYMPGFWTGGFIQKHGIMRACQIALACWLAAFGINIAAPNSDATTVTWYLGLILIGVGWNFGFSSATVWSTKAYDPTSSLKPKVQAANECGMFFLSGATIVSTGYIYEDAGGGGIEGWRLLNYFVLGFCLLYGLLILYASRVNISGTSRTSSYDATALNTAPKEEVEEVHTV